MPTKTYVFTDQECERWRAVEETEEPLNPRTRFPIRLGARYGVGKQLQRQCLSEANALANAEAPNALANAEAVKPKRKRQKKPKATPPREKVQAIPLENEPNAVANAEVPLPQRANAVANAEANIQPFNVELPPPPLIPKPPKQVRIDVRPVVRVKAPNFDDTVFDTFQWMQNTVYSNPDEDTSPTITFVVTVLKPTTIDATVGAMFVQGIKELLRNNTDPLLNQLAKSWDKVAAFQVMYVATARGTEIVCYIQRQGMLTKPVEIRCAVTKTMFADYPQINATTFTQFLQKMRPMRSDVSMIYLQNPPDEQADKMLAPFVELSRKYIAFGNS